MKVGIIIFHKKHEQYPSWWVSDCLESIRKQTYQNVQVYECDYGGEKKQIYEGSKFWSKKFKNHAEAHNFLCYEAINDGCGCVANVNIDDLYHYERIEQQVRWIEKGYDIVSSNMTQMDGENFTIRQNILFSEMNILEHFAKGHNIIAHPAVIYSKRFILESGLLRGEEIPKDDFELWKRSINKFSFKIVPLTLLFYRIHGNNISGKKK